MNPGLKKKLMSIGRVSRYPARGLQPISVAVTPAGNKLVEEAR